MLPCAVGMSSEQIVTISSVLIRFVFKFALGYVDINIYSTNFQSIFAQQIYTCSKLTIKGIEQDMKLVQN